MPKKHASDNLSARECLALVTLELVLLTIHYCMGAVGHAGVGTKKGGEMKNYERAAKLRIDHSEFQKLCNKWFV